MDTRPEHARREYREWADGEHWLWEHYEGKLGLDDTAYAEAIARTQAAPTSAT